MQRPPALAASVLTAAALLAGCSKEEEPVVPAACKEGTQAVLAALESAPEPVRLAGGESLSDCMAAASDAADVQELGASYIEAMRRLAERAPGGRDTAVQAGYLMGAAQAGIERNIGVHEEVVRRMEIELADVRLDRGAYREGERAGREHG